MQLHQFLLWQYLPHKHFLYLLTKVILGSKLHLVEKGPCYLLWGFCSCWLCKRKQHERPCKELSKM